MASLVAAMSRASTSGVRRAKAFLVPSGLKTIISYALCFMFPPLGPLDVPDEGVDLDAVNVVKLLKSSLDLPLVGLGVDDEDKGVVLLNLLHGALGVERVKNDLVGVEAGLVLDALAGELGRARELEGLGTVEGRRKTDLADLVRVDLLENRPSAVHSETEAC
jgi:hypothetical protein